MSKETTKALVLKQFGLTTGTVSYSEQVNAFITAGYTSAAGNTYFNTIRFAEGIVLKEDVAIGHTRKFLNGLKVYSLEDRTLLVDRSYNNFFYNKFAIKEESINMLMDVLQNAAKRDNLKLNKKQARKEIEKIIDSAMNVNQISMLEQQSKKYLTR